MQIAALFLPSWRLSQKSWGIRECSNLGTRKCSNFPKCLRMLQLQSWGIPGNAPTALPKKLEHSRECLNLYSAAGAIQCIKELYRRPSHKVGAFANAPTSELEHSRECSNCSPKIVGAFPGMLLRMPELGHSRMPKLFWESLLVRLKVAKVVVPAHGVSSPDYSLFSRKCKKTEMRNIHLVPSSVAGRVH